MGKNHTFTADPAHPRRICALAAIGFWAALLTGLPQAGNAQEQTPGQIPAPGPVTQPPAAAPPSPQPRGLFPLQPSAVNRPQFLNDFAHWWDSARDKLEDFKKQSDDAAKNAAQATKEAATTIVRLPGVRMVEARERCPVAPNGAPDCRAAATNVCRSKGFSGGNPVDVRSSENCPSAVLLSGRLPAAGECPVETVVLRAICQ